MQEDKQNVSIYQFSITWEIINKKHNAALKVHVKRLVTALKRQDVKPLLV